MKSILIFLISLFACSSLFAIAPITGDTTVCQGLTATVIDATPGGTWSSTAPSIASVGSLTGIVSGLSVGTVILTYTVGASYAVHTFSVFPLYPITGSSVLCPGDTIGLSNTAPSGVWSSSSTLIAVISGTGGLSPDWATILGLSPGIDTITYTTTEGCTSKKVITVSPVPGPIIGSNHICIVTAAVLTNAVPGGVWSSNNPAIASIGMTTGIDTGISLGVTSITYSVGTGCAAIMPLTVNPIPGPISGPSTVCTSDSILLINTDAGGVWSSSNTAVATAGPAFGNVFGVSAGVATISYYFNSTCYVTHTVTVNQTPTLSGSLTPPAICSGTLFSYIPTSIVPGTTFSWTRAVVAGISNPAAAGTGGITEVLTNTTTSPVVVTYSYMLSDGVCLNNQLVNVTVNPVPQLSSSLTPPSICDSTIFNYTPTSSTPGTSFAWSRALVSGIAEVAGSGAGNPDEQLINTTSLPIPVAYIYVLTAYGCTNMQTISVTVNPTPMLSSSLDLPPQCDTIPFIYVPTSTTPGFTFACNRPAISGITPPTSWPSGTIDELLTNHTTSPIFVTYQIRLSAYGCTNSFSQDVVVSIIPCSPLLGLPEKQVSETFKITPNPATGVFNIAGLNSATSLELFNLLGQKVVSRNDLMNGVETIDITDQPSGVYFVVVKGTDGIITSKVLKQ